MSYKKNNHGERKDKNVSWQPLTSPHKTGDKGAQMIPISRKPSRGRRSRMAAPFPPPGISRTGDANGRTRLSRKKR